MLSFKGGNTREILEAVNTLKQRTDGSQIEMTQQCEKILNAAEKIQNEKQRGLKSYNSQEQDLNQLDVIHEYDEKLKEFQ